MSFPIQCASCVHLKQTANTPLRCAAFPKAIPDEILTGEFDHKQPHPRDNGIRFKSIDESSRGREMVRKKR